MKQLFEAGDEALERLEELEKFRSKHNSIPVKEADTVITRLRRLADKPTTREDPKTYKQALSNDFTRRLQGEAFRFEQSLSHRVLDLGDLKQMYSIPDKDLESLRPWLEEHKGDVQHALTKLFEKQQHNEYEMNVPTDIPNKRRQAEGMVENAVRRYHNTLGNLLNEITEVGEFLRDITTGPTTKARSYFSMQMNRLAIGIPAVTRQSSTGSIELDEKELIKLYGHEGMGHALHKVVSSNADLPGFLQRETNVVRSTMESIAQFYERQVFQDIKNHPEVQSQLDIEHKFPDMLEEVQEAWLTKEYDNKLFQYSIKEMAETDGEFRDQQVAEDIVNRIAEVCVNPNRARALFENNAQKTLSNGQLSFGLLQELTYATESVERSIEIFENSGLPYDTNRDLIDNTILNGFWTPKGLTEYASVTAERES